MGMVGGRCLWLYDREWRHDVTISQSAWGASRVTFMARSKDWFILLDKILAFVGPCQA